MLNLNQLKKLYVNSPMWMKKLYASIPYEIRNGSEYRKWKAFLQDNTNKEEYTFFKIKETVLYAYESTKYYNTEWKKLGISPYDINSIKDFKSLPFISKDIVRNNFSDFMVQKYPKNKTFYVTTGGSSGDPMKYLQSNNIWIKELAFGMNYFSKYGYKPSMLKASFRGGEFNDLKKDQYWKYNPIHNEVHFSPFHINKNTIFSYVKDLNKLRPKFFHTYPSSLLLLIEQMQEQNLKLDYQVEAVFLISENFLDEDVTLIKDFLKCKVSSFYGHSERLIFAPSYDDALSSYQPDFRYGYAELINKNDDIITENHEEGEIVGTSFDNFAMPLIRYKTEDYTSYIDKDNDVISLIDGRWTKEYLLGTDGFKLYLTALNMHSNIFKNVIAFQYHQTEIAKVDLWFVVNKKFTKTDSIAILNALHQKAGHAIKFNVKIVNQLKLTKRGKLQNVIRTINA